ncbi:MAG: YgjP-like metallopeptidase domain-containing protein [Cyanobacteria bacterium J06623_5]
MSQLDLFSTTEFAQADVPVPAVPAAASQMPSYAVRESQRAKHVSIKISVEGEVEVVVPPRFDRSRLPEILERRRDWILKTRSRLLRDHEQAPKEWKVEKPDKILFRWRSETVDAPTAKRGLQRGFQRDPDLEAWSVTYQPSLGNSTRCIPQRNQRLTIQGNTDHLPACQAVLRKWLAHRAQRDLAPWLRQLGFELDLPCHRISVRGQKTRWASCSNHKDISLNFKLLFLPRPLVHYVLVHELCHTVHMNHSKQFWALVGEKQPDYPWRRDALKTAWRYVPRWVEAK